MSSNTKFRMLDAIDDFFADTGRSPEQTLEGLEEASEKIEGYISAMKDDMR